MKVTHSVERSIQLICNSKAAAVTDYPDTKPHNIIVTKCIEPHDKHVCKAYSLYACENAENHG